MYRLKERFFKTLCAFVNLIVAVGILQLYFAAKTCVLIKKYSKEAIWIQRDYCIFILFKSFIIVNFGSVESNNVSLQFAIFNPWKVPWNWIAFYQSSFVISPGWLLYQLIRRDTGRLANEAFTSNPILRNNFETIA